MFEFLIVGDVHCDKPKPYPNYLKVAVDTLKGICNYAKDEGIKHIFLLGDIFETPYPSDTTKIEILKLLDDKDLFFYIILGNHEWSSNELNSLELLSYLANTKYSNVSIFLQPTCRKIGGLRFQFLPFPCEKPISDKKSICLAHTGFDGFLTDSGRQVKGTKLDKKHSWFVGHLHLRQGNIYPGSILQNNFGETEDKYFFHCIAENEGSIQVKAVAIPQTYKLKKVIIKTDSDWKKLKPNPNIYYKIDVKNDLVIPNLEKYNIVNIGYFKKETELSDTELVLSKEEMEICNPTLYLSSFLKKKGLGKEKRIKAKNIIKNIMKGL